MENKLPEEIQKQIRKEAEAYMNYRLNGMVHDEIHPDQLITAYDYAASEWAQWKVRYDELNVKAKIQEAAIELLAEKHLKLKERCDKMEKALDKIANPIKHMQQEAEKESAHIDGVYAYQLSENASYLKSIAAQALKEGESNTPAPVQGESDQFGFAEWATGIAFFDDTYRLWEFYEEGKRIDTKFRFTTAELYQVYLKEVGNG